MRILNTMRIGEKQRGGLTRLEGIILLCNPRYRGLCYFLFSGKLKENVRKINPTNKIGQNIFFLGNLSSNRFFLNDWHFFAPFPEIFTFLLVVCRVKKKPVFIVHMMKTWFYTQKPRYRGLLPTFKLCPLICIHVWMSKNCTVPWVPPSARYRGILPT